MNKKKRQLLKPRITSAFILLLNLCLANANCQVINIDSLILEVEKSRKMKPIFSSRIYCGNYGTALADSNFSENATSIPMEDYRFKVLYDVYSLYDSTIKYQCPIFASKPTGQLSIVHWNTFTTRKIPVKNKINELFKEFSSWLQLLKIHGIAYLRDNNISPTDNTHFYIKNSKNF
jgi:hypothetical protein